jgi:PAS domain S-box-containing protein
MGGDRKPRDGGIAMTPGFFHGALEMVEDAIIITDTSGTIGYLNKKAREHFGYGERESVGKSIGMLFLPDDLTYFLPNILRKTKVEMGYEGENLLRRKNNTRVFVRMTTSLYGGDGKVDWIVFTIQDITKLKELQRNYYESERLASLGRMVEEIAHKIRNPIVSIGGFARRISRTMPQGDHLQYFKRIEQEISRLEGIIGQVQNFTTLPKPDYKKENVRKIIEASLESVSTSVSEKRLRIDFQVQDPNWDPLAFFDGPLLTKALGYILENAVEAIDGEGAIHVRLFSKDDFIGIEISDSGCGIPQENLGAIFEPFFSTKPGRVGIGLATAHRIIREHGGTIQVVSQQGEGTGFSIFLPTERRRKIRTQHLL